MEGTSSACKQRLRVQVLLESRHDPLYSWVWRVVNQKDQVVAEGTSITATHGFEEAERFIYRHQNF